MGRLLTTLFLVEREILPSPLLYLSAFFEATRQDYYDRLRGLSDRGEWPAWLEYFLNGVARQAEDALDRARRINDLLSEWRKAVAGAASKTPAQLVDLCAATPSGGSARAGSYQLQLGSQVRCLPANRVVLACQAVATRS